MSEPAPIDNSLVWAVHDGVAHAALVGRRFLDSSANEGWREVDETHPKVKAAQRNAAAEPEPAPEIPVPVVSPAEPTAAAGRPKPTRSKA